MSLFRRTWKVTVDNLDVTPLHLEFRVLRTIKAEPNKASLTLYNLSEDHRAQLMKRNQSVAGSKKLVGIPVRIEAGYVDDTTVIFDGDLSSVTSKLEGVDWKTTLAGADGGRSWRESRIKTQFAKGTPYGTVLKQCCDALGIGIGNAGNFQTSAQVATGASALPFSMAVDGAAHAALDRVVKSMRVPDAKGVLTSVTWSIQRGALQLLQKGQPLNQAAIKISPSTGLVGSPEASIDSTVSLGSPQQFAAGAKTKKPSKPKPKDPGIVKFKTLMIPGMTPGRKVTLESQNFNGGYALSEVLTEGSSFGQSWYHNCVARLYS